MYTGFNNHNYTASKTSAIHIFTNATLPTQFDARLKGAATPVKD